MVVSDFSEAELIAARDEIVGDWFSSPPHVFWNGARLLLHARRERDAALAQLKETDNGLRAAIRELERSERRVAELEAENAELRRCGAITDAHHPLHGGLV